LAVSALCSEALASEEDSVCAWVEVVVAWVVVDVVEDSLLPEGFEPSILAVTRAVSPWDIVVSVVAVMPASVAAVRGAV
tara:strand:+ start:310 stop:546 length:237 start_codon:yes stop_codon:yes gene_type:complete